jgi:hypothetical protein
LLTPFLGITVLVYGLVVLLVGPDAIYAALSNVVFSVDQLPSLQGALPTDPSHTWEITVGDLFVTAGLVFLSMELVKASSTKNWSMGNHGLSLLTLVVCILLFVLVPGFTTTCFFFLTMMAFVDVSVGAMVTTNSAKRDIGIGGGVG